jgi:outer membrane receptor protein involved in Fe transport
LLLFFRKEGLPSCFRTSSRIWLFAAAALVPNAAIASQQPVCAGKSATCRPTPKAHVKAEKPQETIVVTAQRRRLLGTASTASEGIVDDQELQLTPAYRPGQLLETVPGLIVTLHSGEGKANQYLLRGYNLDHGTDLETIVDGMPVNQPTHAHGQGYTDLNFLIPELAEGLSYTKGPYYADVGDFGGVGSVRVRLRYDIADQISVAGGSFGFERVFAAGSQPVGRGELLEAAELQHYDGPFDTPDDARKENATVRYSQALDNGGLSLTTMIYHQVWTNTTDIPIRAITEGVVPDRFASLDPSDGGHALRASLSGDYHTDLGDGQLSVNGFYIHNELHLFNDFTHFLIDPVHGDQEDQFENRNAIGGTATYSVPVRLAGIDTDFSAGVLTRYDILNVGRLPSEGQQPLPRQESLNDPPSYLDSDRVNLFAAALYVQADTHWTGTLRTLVGLRDDFQDGSDFDAYARLHETAGYSNGGTKQQSLLQPKASVIYRPWRDLELYLSAGEGFHSADLRGVNQDRSVDLGLPGTPLLARQIGEELGARAQLHQDITLTVSVFNLYQQSETIIDPDVGTDSAGPPSERYGYEVNLTYQIRKWLEFYASYSGDHTRFTRPFDDGTGHLGEYITDAPNGTGSAALYVQHLGPWSGGLDVRYLGDYPLSSGPCVNSAAVHDFPGIATSCADAPTPRGQVNGKGFAQVNLDVHYALGAHWVFSLGIYNLLNTRASAAEFFYVDRLKSEIASYPDGRAGVHEHPLEPLMARIAIARLF